MNRKNDKYNNVMPELFEETGCVLSFSKGNPLARIKGGAYNNKIIKLYDKENKKIEENLYQDDSDFDSRSNSSIDYEDENFTVSLHLDDIAKLFKKFVNNYEDKEDAVDKITILVDYLKINKTPTEEDLVELFNNNKAILNGERGKYMNLKEGSFVILPNLNSRICIYIAGPSGSGKSTWASIYAIEYNKMFPDRLILLFSRKLEDPVFDNLDFVRRIIINEDLSKDPIHYKELKNTLCIFDDIDTIPNKNIKQTVHNLVNDLLEIGRSSNISVIRMSHQINKGNETRTVINESHMIVLFPKYTLKHWIEYFCSNYLGFDKKLIEEIINIKSRSVAILKNYPITYIHEKGIKMLQ